MKKDAASKRATGKMVTTIRSKDEAIQDLQHLRNARDSLNITTVTCNAPVLSVNRVRD